MTGLGYSHLKMEGTSSCQACGTPVARFDVDPCEPRQHVIDEVTKNCTACGATREWIELKLQPICVPDGKPHPRMPTKFDTVQP